MVMKSQQKQKNGKVAVDKYKEAAPDLTLMDITMPGDGWYSALKGIKAIDPSANVIMCSARDSRQW